MKQRLDYKTAEPKLYEAMLFMEKTTKGFDIEPKLLELIKIRASQLNGCGFCLDMHARDARKIGESEQRLYTVAAWWETPFFSEEEQVALKLTEEVTLISKKGVSDETYQKAIALFGEKGFARLLLAIITINGWNRIAVATHLAPPKTE
jgi:AhpD family alkylhydroperoxidase